MDSSPVQHAREALGQRLREIRLDVPLTARELSRRMGRHWSKISRIEHGAAVPSAADIAAWCALCGAEDQAEELVAALRSLNEMWREWRRLLRHGTAQRQTEQIHLEAGAALLSWFEPAVIPGVLHTPAYAAGVLSKIIDFVGIPDDLDAGIAARMKRQELLYRGDHRFHLLLGEQALYTRVGDAATMAGQLDRLLGVHGLARVSLGIIPRTAAFEVLTGGFIIFDSDRVMVETISAELTITRPSEIGFYLRAFAALSAQAVYGSQARTLIMAAAEALAKE